LNTDIPAFFAEIKLAQESKGNKTLFYIRMIINIEIEKNNETGKISPVHLADSLAQLCNMAIDEVKEIKTDKDVDLLYEVKDIKAWSFIGLYFSNKLRASVEYKRYKASNNKKDLDNAIEWLSKATQNWRSLVEITTPFYKIVPLTHYCDNAPEYKEELFHWSILENQVKAELDWLKNLKHKTK